MSSELTGWEATKEFARRTAQVTQCVVENPFTMVEAQFMHHGITYKGTGFSKCHAKDTFQSQVGFEIAKGRAIGKALQKARSTTT